MTKKQELKELKNIASGQVPTLGGNRLASNEEMQYAQSELKKLEEKEAKSKARFMIFNQGKQEELRRRIKEIVKEKHRQEEKKRIEAHQQAMANLNDFATEHKLKD